MVWEWDGVEERERGGERSNNMGVKRGKMMRRRSYEWIKREIMRNLFLV